MQFRYHGNRHPDNYPENLSENTLINGTLFNSSAHGTYSNISKIGIQGRPGVRFYLNSSVYSIEIGETGIYELDLEGYGIITSIKFDDSIGTFYSGENNDRMLIDIVYEEGGVNQ